MFSLSFHLLSVRALQCVDTSSHFLLHICMYNCIKASQQIQNGTLCYAEQQHHEIVYRNVKHTRTRPCAVKQLFSNTVDKHSLQTHA